MFCLLYGRGMLTLEALCELDGRSSEVPVQHWNVVLFFCLHPQPILLQLCSLTLSPFGLVDCLWRRWCVLEPWSGSLLHHLQALWSWASFLTFLCFILFTCSVGTIKVSVRMTIHCKGRAENYAGLKYLLLTTVNFEEGQCFGPWEHHCCFIFK